MNILEVTNLSTSYESVIIHDDISFFVKKGEIFSILGGSGSGKTTLLKSLIFLKRPLQGSVKIADVDIWKSDSKRSKIVQKIGVVFQFGALFTSLNVLENVAVMLDEYSLYPKKLYFDIAKLWIQNVGLPSSVYLKYPDELSGGMRKRVALARALCVEPEILFLDEPTSGLDPLSAERFDELILGLRDRFGVSVVMITHDLDSIKDATDRFILLGDKKIKFCGSLKEFSLDENKKLYEDSLFNSKRGLRFL